MPLVQAYQCPRTSNLFAHKSLYVSHLKSMARMSLDRRAEKRRRDAMAARMAPLYLCSTLEEISQWVMDNSELVFWNAYQSRQPHELDTLTKAQKFVETFKIVSFDLDISYNGNCSNSHVSPAGKPTNWCAQDKSMPTGYPGMRGKISYKTERENPLSFEILKAMKMHNGTASGGKHTRGEITLFAEEWPALCVRHYLENA